MDEVYLWIELVGRVMFCLVGVVYNVFWFGMCGVVFLICNGVGFVYYVYLLMYGYVGYSIGWIIGIVV